TCTPYSQPRAQYTNTPTYSLMIERLAVSVRTEGCHTEKSATSGAVIWGGVGTAVTCKPCWLNTATARGICKADVTSKILLIPNSRSCCTLYKSFSRVLRLSLSVT